MVLEELILEGLRYFDSDEQRRAFLAARIAPYEVIQSWSWSNDKHTCTVIARDAQLDRPEFHRHSVAALRVAPFKLYR